MGHEYANKYANYWSKKNKTIKSGKANFKDSGRQKTYNAEFAALAEYRKLYPNNKKTAKFFLDQINSSIAIHNASTQFADGGEFGFGGEIGISTSKIPPRGPVGINQLTSYKSIVEGNGTIRQ